VEVVVGCDLREHDDLVVFVLLDFDYFAADFVDVLHVEVLSLDHVEKALHHFLLPRHPAVLPRVLLCYLSLYLS